MHSIIYNLALHSKESKFLVKTVTTGTPLTWKFSAYFLALISLKGIETQGKSLVDFSY
jgi:hypothetical protein